MGFQAPSGIASRANPVDGQKSAPVVTQKTIEIIPCCARVEKAVADHDGIEDPCIAEACLGAGERVEKPRGVGEVGSHGQAGCAEEVHEGLGGRMLRVELSVMWQR